MKILKYIRPTIEKSITTFQPFMENVSIGVGDGAHEGGGAVVDGEEEDAFVKEKNNIGNNLWGD